MMVTDSILHVFGPWSPPQVLVLELETRLQKERERLGELRKKHYELAGAAEGWGDEDQGEHPPHTCPPEWAAAVYSHRFIDV